MIIYHIIKKGDCLKKLSENYKIPIQKICDDNGITNVDSLRIGDKLIIEVNDNECIN